MRKKRELVVIVIIFIIVFLTGLICFSLIRVYKIENKQNECQTNEDCVPASCCHSTSCTSKVNAPNCSGISCTLSCEPETLDCQQGKCICIKNKCQAKIT